MKALTPLPFSLSFHLGSIPVVIQPTFWLTALLMGSSLPAGHVVIWVAVMLVSILLHELGHALAYRLFGAGSGIELLAFGGRCYGDRDVGRWPGVIVSLAGPFAMFLFAGAAWFAAVIWEAPPEPVLVALQQIILVNVFWGLMNLLPVLPLDGGRVLEGVLGPRLQWRLPLVSGIVAVAVALAAANYGFFIGALLFGFFAYQNLAAYGQGRPAAVRAPLQAPPKENAERLQLGWNALHAGSERDAARLGQAVLDQTARKEERAAALDLLAWASLAAGEVSNALSYLRKIDPPELARPLTWALAHDAAAQPGTALPFALQAFEVEPTDTSAALAARLLAATGDGEGALRLIDHHTWRNPGAAERTRADVGAAARQTG